MVYKLQFIVYNILLLIGNIVMKILLPYISRNGEDITSKNITGGIEKFCQNLYNLFPDEIIPIKITKEDIADRKAKNIFLDSVNKYNPDLILINEINRYFHDPLIKKSIPTILIMHGPLHSEIVYLDMVKNFHTFIESGGHLYFVSEHQFNHFNKLSIRITGRELKNIKGYIDSSYSDGTEMVSKDRLYDVITVGRCDKNKAPFLVHEKLKDTKLKTSVVTCISEYSSNNDKLYMDKNSNWKDPNYTFINLDHDDIMKKVSSSGCFISTMTIESWGISAFEAFVRGVPVILLCNKSNAHASECIPADKSHYRIVSSKIKQHELEKIVNELLNFSFEKRLEISNMTKEKHSKEKYKLKFISMFNLAVKETVNQYTKNLDSFF